MVGFLLALLSNQEKLVMLALFAQVLYHCLHVRVGSAAGFHATRCVCPLVG